MPPRTAAQTAIATTGEFPITLLAVGLPRGTVLHLFDEQADRTQTLCGRRITVNPRYLGVDGRYAQSSDNATCQRCVKVASTL